MLFGLLMSFLFFLSLLYSCSAMRDENGRVKSVLVETTDTLSFPLEKGVNMFINSIYVYTDSLGHEYLTFRDRYETPRIFVYDMEKPMEPHRKITFEREGINGTGASSVGYFIRSWDEIYIPNLHSPEISVIDSSGVKKRSYRLAESSSELALKTSSNSPSSLIFHDNKMYCKQASNRFKEDDYMIHSPVDIIVNLDDGTSEPSSFCYPSEHMLPLDQITKSGLDNYQARCYNEDTEEIIYSFWFNENVYRYNIKTGEVLKKRVRSQYIPDEEQLNPANRLNTNESGLKEICEMAFYKFIYYDRYRKVYYRFAFPETTCANETAYVDYFQAGRNTSSVMVLDEDLNILGETLLPENRFNTTTMFINRDGLWISCNHYLNPGYDEENLTFVRFEINETE